VVRLKGGEPEPEKMEWERLLKRYGECLFVMQMEAELIAKSVSKIYQ